jgi:hypothetical protein
MIKVDQVHKIKGWITFNDQRGGADKILDSRRDRRVSVCIQEKHA